jgi:hypothetical protein
MQIGGPVADSEFVFTPPDGAKEVARLSMFGGKANALPDLVGKPAPPFANPGVSGQLGSPRLPDRRRDLDECR